MQPKQGLVSQIKDVLASSEDRATKRHVLAVTALGSTRKAARARAYEAVSRIHFENCHYRRDIALGATN